MMGMRDKIAANVAGNISGKAEDLFKDIIRIQESMHAHLEKILEVQRLTYDEIRAVRYQNTEDNKVRKTLWKDDEQQ